MLFSFQEYYCVICGVLHSQNFNNKGSYGKDKCCCSKECYEEWEWRKTLAILGKPYRPRQ